MAVSLESSPTDWSSPTTTRAAKTRKPSPAKSFAAFAKPATVVTPCSSIAAAIAGDISHAHVGDVVLLAGKGHETYQEAAGERQPFLDWDHATRALAAWSGR
jgi:UDP-N-acetylmuramyl tripeptide synthase